MPDAYAETEDVRQVLQEASLSGPLANNNTEAALERVSDWLRRQSRGHWYDSGGSTTLVPSSSRTASAVTLDVPSSPHRQRGQLFTHDRDIRDQRYPVTRRGSYVRLTLPHRHVTALETLEVRDIAGDVEDWVSASDKQSGRGEDYYLEQNDRHPYGRTHLFLRAASIGPRIDFDGLVTLSYVYGLDAATEEWQDVRGGVASAAAAELVIEDDVLTAIPDDGQLVGVDTKRQRLVDDARSYLEPYLTPPRPQ